MSIPNRTGRTHTHTHSNLKANDLCKYARLVCYESADPFVGRFGSKSEFSLRTHTRRCTAERKEIAPSPWVLAAQQKEGPIRFEQIGRGMHAKLSKSRPLAPRSAGNRGQRCNKFNAAAGPPRQKENLNLGEFTAQAAANCAMLVLTKCVRVQIIKWPVNYNISGRLTESTAAEQ